MQHGSPPSTPGSGPHGGGAGGPGGHGHGHDDGHRRSRRRRRGRRWRRGREQGGQNPSAQGNAPHGGPQPHGGGAAHPARAHAPAPAPSGAPFDTSGVLEVAQDGGGFLRQPLRNYRPSTDDVYVPRDLLAPYALPSHTGPTGNGTGLEGCEVEGLAIGPRPGAEPAPVHEEERHGGRHRGQHARRGGGGGGGGRGNGPRLSEIRTLNGLAPDAFAQRRPFSTLTSIDPFERIRLETEPAEVSTRVIDLLTPIGKGQRCLIVAPPRAGKTTLLQKIAAAISKNHPEIHLVVLLVDERPEEVTDMKRNVNGEVIASSSDELARQHVSLARIVLERARRLVEVGHDVVILLDSLTRLARAHNAATPGTGRTLSGGLDARTMEQPRRLFGAARKAEEGGSLTVIATALVDTGSRMDDVIFQEFKGTGNMELVLDRALFEQRIYPAVDIARSGTRKEEKLFAKEDVPRIHRLRRVLFDMKPNDAMMKLIDKLSKYPSNAAFLKAIDA
ncbi:MAG TPA: transcription termination factor Rho [Patescibacteria group bacterium]|nr:transcription termination factor Rho [Patescibacteria group bacterium]